jgi:hypothetical protein
MRFTQQSSISGRSDTADGMQVAGPNHGYAVNIALVYQDALTRQWAEQVREQLGEVVGEEAIHCTEWKIGDLEEPRVYSEGVRALARADVIVVSLYEAERFPSVFYLWVNLWLQVRSEFPGALVALVVPGKESRLGANETRRYLHAVAGQGRLELVESNQPGRPIRFLLQESFKWRKAA